MTVVDTQMDSVSKDELHELLVPQSGLALSMYMPTYRKGAEVQQNAIRFKNLLATAEKKLHEQGEKDPESMLSPAHALLSDTPFWQQQSDGLAVFLGEDHISTYRLPISFNEAVIAGNRFYVRPLLDTWHRDDKFFVLELTLGGVSLWQGDRLHLDKVELGDDVPTSLEEALQYDDIESHLQYHTGTGRTTDSGKRGAMFHGQGGSQEADDKENVLRFLRALDNGVCERIGDSQTPLVLIGVNSAQGAYRQVNHHEGLVEQGISMNPQDLDAGEAHAQAWDLVAPHFNQKRDESLNVFKHLAGNNEERATTALKEIVSAAYFQRVDTLFLQDTERRWGAFDAEANSVDVHEEAQDGDDELLNFAAVHTLLNGGRVYTLDASQMPASTPVSAILRY